MDTVMQSGLGNGYTQMVREMVDALTKSMHRISSLSTCMKK